MPGSFPIPDRTRCGSLLAGLALAALAGCATRSPAPGRDGPGLNPPEGLERIADAVPRVEPLRVGGPNKPYVVLGQRYVPMRSDEPLWQTGLASWYGRKFQGQPTSSGEIYDMYAMTAAHKTMPIPSYARVRNPANGREVTVRINDRGPFAEGRIIDLSYAAALRLDLLRGVAPVEVRRLTHDDIRAGRSTMTALAGDGPRTAANDGPAMPVPVPVPVPAAMVVDAAWRGAEARPDGAPVARSGAPPSPVAESAPTVASTPAAPPLPTDTGVAPTRPPTPAIGPDGVPALTGWWLQIGAFKVRDSALQLQQRALRDAADLPTVAVFDSDALFRVQAGPYATRSQAQDAAARLRQQLGIDPLLLERTP